MSDNSVIQQTPSSTQSTSHTFPLSSISKGHLHLANGTTFSGRIYSWEKEISEGEVVFTTGMSGYPETLTDPSYAGQIIVFTYPLIGNYGVPPSLRWESKKIWARGVVVSEECLNWSHYEGMRSLLDWLEAEGVPLLGGVDTRELTKTLREHGTIQGALSTTTEAKLSPEDLSRNHYVSRVSIDKPAEISEGTKTVIAVDCGMKENIARSLTDLPVKVKRVPHNYDFTNEPFDGVFLSNGPGDPEVCVEAIEILKKALKMEKPVFGICLGSQLMALAAGATTFKLPFGHRGHNQPCQDVETGRCFITSQNHGYAVDEKSLPDDWKVTFRNLNDGTVEGIAHKSLPYFAVQFHPEAAPGPTDTAWMFETFYKML